MKKILTLTLLLFTSFIIKAQQKGIIISEDKRNACFLYAEAESPINPNVKILIVSSYIYRKKYKETDASDKLSNASTNYFDAIVNPFLKKLKEIETNERVFVAGSAKDIVFDEKVVNSYKSSVYAEGFCPITADEKLKMPQFTTTTAFSKDCRTRFIRAKRQEGYRVFQVAFDEYYETRNLPYGSLWTEEHYKLVVDQVEKLSPLEVDVYRPGLIKDLPNYKIAPASDYKMPGLVVTRSSSSGSSGSGSSSSSGSRTKSSSSSSSSSDYTVSPICSSYSSFAEAKYTEGSNLATVKLSTWTELIDAVDKYYSYGCPISPRMNELKNYASAQNEATGQAVVDVFSGIGGFFGMFNWEFKGSSSTLVNKKITPPDQFQIDEVSWNLITGTDGIRFAFSPLSFTWVSLPGYKKYYEESTVVTDAQFGQSTFYTPSFSLRYHFMSKKARKNQYRSLEFPLAAQFSVLLFPRNSGLVRNNPDKDDKFVEYLDFFNFYANASFGVNVYLSKGFGLGLSGGGTYVGIHESEFAVTETNTKGVSKDFKIKFNDAERFIPTVDFKVLVRF